MLFLVVEFAGGELPFIEFTRLHPGSTVDLIIEAQDARRSGPHTRQETVFLVKGAPWPATEAFVNSVAAAHGTVHPIRREPRLGVWLGRVGLRPRALEGPTAYVLNNLLRGLGAPWIHCEGGVLHLRVRLPEPEPPGLVEGAEAALAFAGIEAQAEAREYGAHDYSVWQELVEQSVGLSL
ncbi:MAG: hypothetical protein ACYDBQ_05565 [Thermoplasmatota archaeon]